MSIHRAAESSRVLGQGQSWMFVVRVGFAGIMMFPLGGGFSAGQALVMQAAMAGVGMAKAVYTNAIQAVGPDAAVIATPMIPGTQSIVSGLIASELCMALVNQAGNNGNQPLIPAPTALTGQTNSGAAGLNSSYITYRYSLSQGDESGNPACGTVSLAGSLNGAQKIAGVSVDMAAVQGAALNNVLNTIRPKVADVAQNLWQNKTAASLAPLQSIYTNAVQVYTQNLTAAATSISSQLNAAVAASATAARNGQSDLLANEVQQSTLGWTAAGAYYLQIAKLNASTLSLLNATPITTSPTYDGIPQSLSIDLAPLETAATQFMTTLDAIVQSSDATRTPNGTPYTLADAKSDAQGPNELEQIFNKLNLTNAAFQTIAGFLLPQAPNLVGPFRRVDVDGAEADEHEPGRHGRGRAPGVGHDLDRGGDLGILHGQLGRRRSHHRRPCDHELLRSTDLRGTAGAPDPGHRHRLRSTDDPLRDLDGRRRPAGSSSCAKPWWQCRFGCSPT